MPKRFATDTGSHPHDRQEEGDVRQGIVTEQLKHQWLHLLQDSLRCASERMSPCRRTLGAMQLMRNKIYMCVLCAYHAVELLLLLFAS